MAQDEDQPLSRERADLLESLRRHRHFLRYTVRDLDDEQAARRTTVSELCLGALVKHVTATERQWAQFAVRGPEAMGTFDPSDPAAIEAWSAAWTMLPEDGLADLLDKYEQVAAQTDELVATVPDLDADHPLPKAPWFQPDARWSVRRVLLHIIAETSQHAGHADIIREALDGQKTMG